GFRRVLFRSTVARRNRLVAFVLASVTAGVIIRIVRITADKKVVEVDILVVAAGGVSVEQLQLGNGSGVRAGERGRRAAAGNHDQRIGGRGSQNELNPQTGPLERNPRVLLAEGSVPVLVVGRAAQEVELQHVRGAGGLQAESNFAGAIHVAVVKVNLHHLPRRQWGES